MPGRYNYPLSMSDRISQRITFQPMEVTPPQFTPGNKTGFITRKTFDADILVWMDTIKEGRFEDTNKLFQNPQKVDFHITEWNDHNHEDIAKEILKNV
mgnify:CR=1 FL=1